MRYLVLVLLAIPTICQAQAPSPYAGMQARPIKSLSDQQIADLKAGRGMGLALPAELNGYPGPAHVLELARSLDLADAQKAKIEALFAAMHAEAIGLGEKVIDAEARLNDLFASKTVTDASLADATRTAARLEGELRAAHLKYHLATLAVMTPEQVVRYGELRGYAAPADHSTHHHP
jgi:Spy/CpxP family protein refolding chaperone